VNENLGVFLTPITLLLGGGLFALGLLGMFDDYSFFKTRVRATAALAIGLGFLVTTEAMFVTSTGSGRYLSGLRNDVTDCEFTAEEANPQERRRNVSSVISNQIKACMDRLGYDWTLEHPHCAEAKIATNLFCYLPKEKFARTIVAYQMKFE
jgi:hypothetical protein